MRFGRRDHESYIGGYDPEHEMPNPDRDPRDRYQSDAYRHNSRDSRIPYRFAPDRYENRGDWPRRGDRHEEIRPRDHYDRPQPDMGRGYDRYGADRGYDRGYDRGGWGMNDRNYGGGYGGSWGAGDRGGYGGGYGYGHDEPYRYGGGGPYRGGDYDRQRSYGNNYGDSFERDRGGYDRGPYRHTPWEANDRWDRERFRDDWDERGGDWDRQSWGNGSRNRY